MDAPLSVATAVTIARAALTPEQHLICDVVAEHVRARTPVTGLHHFWELVAKTLKERHGISRGHTSIQKEYEGLKNWFGANRPDEHVNVRKWLKREFRRSSRRQASANEEGGGDEHEDEDEAEEEKKQSKALPAITWELTLRSAGPTREQTPPAGEEKESSLSLRPKGQ